MYRRVIQLPNADDVPEFFAQQLLNKVLELQEVQDEVHICLTGGVTANAMYERFAELASAADLDAAKLHLWWGDERFVAATDPDRNSLQAVERLARTVPISSAHIHMMAAKDGHKDPHDSAEVYETELGDTQFDVTILGMGPTGHCASLFPDHPSFEPTTRLVIGVENAPIPPEDRISLTLNALNRSKYVWFMVTGAEKAPTVARIFDGDLSMPAAHVRGKRGTFWFLDDSAASKLPQRFRCEF